MRVKQPLPAGVEAVIRAVQAGAGQLGLEPLLVGGHGTGSAAGACL